MGAAIRPMSRGSVHEVSVFRRQLADTRPLREPHFRRLWVANIVTVIGAQLSIVAVPQ